MNKFTYKEYDYVQEILKNGFITKYNYYESSLLCKFWASLGICKKDVEDNLVDFCMLYTNNFNYALEYKTIDKAVLSAFGNRRKLIQIDSIPIYKHEFDYINNIDIPQNYKRLMFSFLVLKKIHSAIWKINSGEDKLSGYLNGNPKQATMLKDMSHLSGGKKDDIDFMIYDLGEKGYINRLALGKDYLVFIDELKKQTSDKLFDVSDFEKVWLYFDHFSGYRKSGKIMICKMCGKPEIHTSKAKVPMYCSDCKKKRRKMAYDKYNKKKQSK